MDCSCKSSEPHKDKNNAEEWTESRGQWTGKADFLLSLISYAVGLGNVWRFPYLCYENGGGAFLVPYFLCLVLCAIPLFLMEVALGQYLSSGGIGVWTLVPILKGIGFASMTIVFLCNVYYVIIVAWTLVYLVSSFTANLPWRSCNPDWSSPICREGNSTNDNSSTPVAEFWERRVLGLSSGIDDIGEIRWELALYLLLAWLLVYLVIWRGLHQSGKVMWFTALFPYVIMTILFFRGVTLDGAVSGLFYYITPEWSKLTEPKVWVAAGTQVYFTFGIGFGSVVTLGSYNKFHHNFLRDSLILCAVNPLTSLFAGSVIFSVLGYMAHLQNVDVSHVVRSGPGLAFLAYPEVVIQLPIAPLWSFLFFFMLIILGIDSQFCTVEAFITGMVDEWPTVLRKRRKLFTAVVCLLLYFLGLPMVTEGGMYIFQLMDFYSASGITLLFTVFFQTVAIAWIYGTNKLSDNVEKMTGKGLNLYIKICLTVFVPIVTAGIFLFSIIRYKPLVYGGVYTYPWWGDMIGWYLALASMMWIPGYAIYFLLTTSGSLRERFKKGSTATISPKHTCQNRNSYKTNSTELTLPAFNAEPKTRHSLFAQEHEME